MRVNLRVNGTIMNEWSGRQSGFPNVGKVGNMPAQWTGEQESNFLMLPEVPEVNDRHRPGHEMLCARETKLPARCPRARSEGIIVRDQMNCDIAMIRF